MCHVLRPSAGQRLDPCYCHFSCHANGGGNGGNQWRFWRMQMETTQPKLTDWFIFCLLSLVLQALADSSVLFLLNTLGIQVFLSHKKTLLSLPSKIGKLRTYLYLHKAAGFPMALRALNHQQLCHQQYKKNWIPGGRSCPRIPSAAMNGHWGTLCSVAYCGAPTSTWRGEAVSQ